MALLAPKAVTEPIGVAAPEDAESQATAIGGSAPPEPQAFSGGGAALNEPVWATASAAAAAAASRIAASTSAVLTLPLTDLR